MSACGNSDCPEKGCWAPECYQKSTPVDLNLPNLHLLPGLSPAQQHLAQALDDLYVSLTSEKVVSIR